MGDGLPQMFVRMNHHPTDCVTLLGLRARAWAEVPACHRGATPVGTRLEARFLALSQARDGNFCEKSYSTEAGGDPEFARCTSVLTCFYDNQDGALCADLRHRLAMA